MPINLTTRAYDAIFLHYLLFSVACFAYKCMLTNSCARFMED